MAEKATKPTATKVKKTTAAKTTKTAVDQAKKTTTTKAAKTAVTKATKTTTSKAVKSTATKTTKATATKAAKTTTGRARTKPVEVEAVVEETAVAEQPKVEVSAKESNPDKFLKDFDWHNYEEGIDPVDTKQLKEFEKLVAENFVDTLDDEVVDGIVIYITDRDAIIDINAKSEGVISLNEFRYNPDLKVGDKVEVLIDVREDATGQLILSHRKARTIKAWERVNKAHDEGTVVNGYVKCRTKGGMIVDVFGIEAFLPGSQIDVKPIRDYDIYVGKTMEF